MQGSLSHPPHACRNSMQRSSIGSSSCPNGPMAARSTIASLIGGLAAAERLATPIPRAQTEDQVAERFPAVRLFRVDDAAEEQIGTAFIVTPRQLVENTTRTHRRFFRGVPHVRPHPPSQRV